MALIADDAAHRAEQLLMMTDRLATLIGEETKRVEAREPPLDGEAADEKNRLANAYRLELARIKHDRSLIDTAPPAMLAQLKTHTLRFHEALAAHELALNAVKVVTEGLVHALAEETVRQRGHSTAYGASGAAQPSSGPNPALVDRNA